MTLADMLNQAAHAGATLRGAELQRYLHTLEQEAQALLLPPADWRELAHVRYRQLQQEYAAAGTNPFKRDTAKLIASELNQAGILNGRNKPIDWTTVLRDIMSD